MAKVTVTVPFNVTFPVDGHVYREGDVFELDRADAEKWLAAGALVEVKKPKR
jgi:hypothetical protein